MQKLEIVVMYRNEHSVNDSIYLQIYKVSAVMFRLWKIEKKNNYMHRFFFFKLFEISLQFVYVQIRYDFQAILGETLYTLTWNPEKSLKICHMNL